MTIQVEPLRQQSPEGSALALIHHTLVLTQRLIRRWSRDPLTLVQSLAFPTGLLVLMNLALGKQVTEYALSNNSYGPGYDSLYGTVPMAAIVGVMAGSAAGAVTLGREREDGLLSRMWVMPVHRASGLLARILGEGARILLGTIIIVAVGYLLGFRFHQGFLAAIGFLCVPMIFGFAFATMVTAMAVVSAKATMVETISLLSSLLMFFSTGFVPLDGFPEFARGFVKHQPLTTATDAMRGLSFGGPVLEPLLWTLGWCTVVIAAFIGPAIVGYGRASRAGN